MRPNSPARRAEQHQVVGAFDKRQTGSFAHPLAVNTGLKVKVKLIQRLDPRKASQFESRLNAALMPTLPFGLQRLGQKAF